MTALVYTPMASPTKSWEQVSWLPPSPAATIRSDCDDNEPPQSGHAVATAFQRDLYNFRTKGSDTPISPAYHNTIDVLDVARLITRPENLSSRVELPPSTRHVRMKSTQFEIPRYVRADCSVRSVTHFTELSTGKTAVCTAPCDTDELVLNLVYPPQRPCHIQAANEFDVAHLTVILTPSVPSSAGPHRTLLEDIQTLVASAALKGHGQDGKPICTIVGDNIPQLPWLVDRTSHEYVRRYYASVGGQIPDGLVEFIDVNTYRERVGGAAFKLHTAW